MSSDDELFASPAGDAPRDIAESVWSSPPVAPPSAGAIAPERPATKPTKQGPRAGLILGIAGGVVAVMLLLVIGVVSWATRQSEPAAAPVATPSEDTSAGPTAHQADGDYATDAAGLALPGTLTRDDRLPQHAKPMPEGQFSYALKGWVLGLYDIHTTDFVDGEEIDNPGPIVVYLASPEGELFQVLELPRDYQYEVLRWKPRQTIAIIAAWDKDAENRADAEPPEYFVLDLLTGELSEAAAEVMNAPYVEYVGKAGDGRDVWVQSDEPGGEFQVPSPQRVLLVDDAGIVEVIAEFPTTRSSNLFELNPGGTRLMALDVGSLPSVILDLSTGETKQIEVMQEGAVWCSHVGWYDDAILIGYCDFADNRSEWGALSRISVFTGEVIDDLLTYDSLEGEDLIFGPQAVRVGDEIIHTMAAPEVDLDCQGSPFYVGEDQFSATGWIAAEGEIQGQFVLSRVIGTDVYASKVGTCPASQGLWEFSVLDVETDKVTIIFPAIELEREQVSESPGLVDAAIGIY